MEDKCIFERVGRKTKCLALNDIDPKCGKECKFYKSNKDYYLDSRGFAVKREGAK